jgi:hypothetical protein
MTNNVASSTPWIFRPFVSAIFWHWVGNIVIAATFLAVFVFLYEAFQPELVAHQVGLIAAAVISLFVSIILGVIVHMAFTWSLWTPAGYFFQSTSGFWEFLGDIFDVFN